jgi:hypothetical protein
MTKFYVAAAIAFCLIGSQAFAAELSKGETTAQFKLKVAACKAEAKESGVKTSSADFYSHMAGCIERVTVAVQIAPEK